VLVRNAIVLDASPTFHCDSCQAEIQDGYRSRSLTWDAVTRAAFIQFGPPTAFGSVDFLVIMGFADGKVRLVFCCQGPRRGEIQVQYDHDNPEIAQAVVAFLKRVREQVEDGEGQKQ